MVEIFQEFFEGSLICTKIPHGFACRCKSAIIAQALKHEILIKYVPHDLACNVRSGGEMASDNDNHHMNI